MGEPMERQNSRSKAKPIQIVKTKMTSNYANIQRNKQIFNTITKNNSLKQSSNRLLMRAKGKTYAKSSTDLESMMNHIDLKGIDDSKAENIAESRSYSVGSNKTASTPKGVVSTNKAKAKKP